MPNYKICRFCPEKYVPIADEKICPKCNDAVLKAVKTAPFGEPILAKGTMSDPIAKKMKEAVDKAHAETIEILTPLVETVAEALAPVADLIVEVAEGVAEKIVAELVEANPEDLQNEKDIIAIEEAVVELDKIEDAIIVKEELIAPAAPKPEEKPDAQS